MNKISLDHVSYVYSQGTPYEQKALDDVSLSIHDVIILKYCFSGLEVSALNALLSIFNST